MRPVLLAVLVITTAAAADWHVAPSGNDSNAGTTAAPLATLSGAINRSASGDRILLQAGGTWRQSGVSIPGGRTLTAWGSGAQPVLTASTTVGGWSTWSQNSAVRTAPAATQVLACWVNGRFMRLARYPNSGWLTVDDGTNGDVIKDAGINGVASGRWTGAQVRWRRWSWWWETRQITAHTVGSLSLGSQNRWQDNLNGIGSSYCIDNSLAELDAAGEWFWGGGTLYVYPPAGVDPASMTVEVVTTTAGISLGGGTIDGVAFKRFGGTALTVNGVATVQNCTFEEIEDTAIATTWSSGGARILGNTMRDVRNVGISIVENPSGAAGTLIERNLLHRIGVEHGYGGSGPWHASGAIINVARAVTFRLNRVYDTGYAGIIVGAAGQTVNRNIFVRTMQTLNDGAAVYTNCNATTISENIILDTLGDLSTSHPWWPLGHGIWPEFLRDFKDSVITDNTVSGSNGNGIVLPNNYTCTITGNTLVDNRESGLRLDINSDTGTGTNIDGVPENTDNDMRAQNHTISGNTLVAVVPTRRIARPEVLNQWWLPPYTPPTPTCLGYTGGVDYGSMTTTTFVAPSSGASPIRQASGSDYSTLSAWASANPSWAVASDRIVRANSILLVNDTEAAATMTVPAGSWTRTDGSAVGATVSIAAFRSLVLVTSGTAPTTPYYTASGIDYRAATPSQPSGTAPTITAQPGNQTVTAGQTATFSVTASGSGLGYQWRRNGSAISGATGASYTTPATTTSDSGALFSVVVTNSAGSVTSANATLTVNAAVVAPAITTQPANQTVTAGQSATFSVAASGSTPLSYQWRRNGAAISGATGASYTTAATTTSDSGALFSVVVTNSAGSVTSANATLTVNAAVTAPAITTHPASQSVFATESVTFTVAASGTGLAYQWQRNGVAISGATGTSYTLTAAASDSGAQYRCVVSNSAGGATSNAATLTVAALRIADAPASTAAGLDYAYYELSTDGTLPNFASLTPTRTGTVANASLTPRLRDVDFAMRFTGWIDVPTDGVYTFATTSDDGTRLLIGTTTVVDNDLPHGMQERTGRIGLKAGKHALTLQYAQGGGGFGLEWRWEGPGIARALIPDARLVRPAAMSSFSARICFQPLQAPVPTGWTPDGGLVYGARNGLTYGWNSDVADTARDRNVISDQMKDTLLHLQKPAVPNAVWEIAVPNGTYQVRLVAGDPSHTDSVFRLALEGQLAVSGTPTTANPHVEATVNVTVGDGRLTLTNASGASNNKVCGIEIIAVPSAAN